MKAAYDSVNRVYLVISGGMGWFLDENGAQLGGSFIIAQESPNLTSPFIAWSDVTFGGPLNDPVFLVTYVVGDQVANTKYGRLVRYGANSSVSIGPRSKVTDIFSEWYASEKAQSVWDGQGFIVGTRVLTSGATWAQPQLNHFDMAGNVSGGVIIGDGLDFEGSPALDCSPSGVCLAVGFASGEPYNYHSGGYGRLFDSRSLLPIGSLFYLDDNTGPGQGQDQGVVFNPSTGKFLVAWQNYGDIYTRLVDVDGTLGPIIKAFGPDAGDNRIKYNSATSTTLLVTKWSPADLYAVELGDDGMPINTGGAVLLSVWDGVLKRYDPAIASDNISGKWLSLFAVSGGYDGAIVTNQYSGSQLFPPEYYEPTSFNPSNQPFGATQTLPNPPAAMPLGDFIGYIFLYSLYMVGLAVFVMITWAGVLWLTSRGNPSQIALAKHKIYNAIIGAIILVSGFAILYSINPALVQGTIRFPGLVPSATTGGNLPNPPPSCLNELGLANQYNEPYPRRDDPELAQLMFCIQNHPSLVGLNLGSIYTYDETYDVCNYTRGNQVCGPCSHSVNSCHYGGSSGTRGSLAVDYGNEAIGNLIIQAAVFCGAKTTAPGDPRCENSQGQRVACNDPMATHVHINAATCDRN